MDRITLTQLRRGVLISCLIVTAAALYLAKASAVPLPQAGGVGSALGGQAATQNGRRVILLGGTADGGLVVARSTYHGEQGLRFHAEVTGASNSSPYCTGSLYVTGDEVGLVPDPSHCPHGNPLPFQRAQIGNVNLHVQTFWSSVPSFRLGGRRYLVWPIWEAGGLRKGEIREADGRFYAWLSLSLTNPSAAERRFAALVTSFAVPLSPDQQATLSTEENNGDSAAQAGKLYDALRDYEAAFQELPTQWAPQDVENRLEKKTIKLVQRMNPKPTIPQDAMRHMAYAETAFQEAKWAAGLGSAIQEMNKALRLAPWWGAAYKNLGLLDEKANRDADAARNLQLYLLATPNAPDAQSVQMKIYSLQYKAKQQAEGS